MLYNEFRPYLMTKFDTNYNPLDPDFKAMDLEGAVHGNLSMLLLRSTYTFNAAHEHSNIAPHYCQHANNPPEGTPVTGAAVSMVNATAIVGASPVTFPSVTLVGDQAPAGVALMYSWKKFVGGEWVWWANTLIGYYQFPAPTPVDNADFIIQFGAGGALAWTHIDTGTPQDPTILYDVARRAMLKGEIDLKNDVIRCGLTTSAYTPSRLHEVYDTDPLESDITEEVSGAGYTQAGEILANKNVIQLANGEGALTADPTSWPSSTITMRRAFFYLPGHANMLLGVMSWNENKVSVSSLLRLIHSGSGIVNI
jgi:hypothetical protein